MHVVGFEDVAVCHVDAQKILDWSDEEDPEEHMKRLEMKPADSTKSPLTPPWVMLEFDQPTEQRDLEHFHANGSTVRTAVPDGTYRDLGMTDFKRQYTLVTPGGGKAFEIDEDN